MNQDARISVGFATHPKTKKLYRRLGAEGPFRLIALWLWAAANRSDGDLAGLDDEDIELAVDWPGDPGVLVDALFSVGFLDGEPGMRALHGWVEHNPWASGARDRADQAQWAALVRRYGREGAAQRMPDYAARTGKAAPGKPPAGGAPAQGSAGQVPAVPPAAASTAQVCSQQESAEPPAALGSAGAESRHCPVSDTVSVSVSDTVSVSEPKGKRLSEGVLPELDLSAGDFAPAGAGSAAADSKPRARAKPAPRLDPDKPTTATWQAYATAYRARYGVDPVRNAKVNSQLAQAVARLGADQAPLVAAYYVRHNSSIFVRDQHSTDWLLAKCEGLHTEMLRGTVTTAAQARQVDQTQTTLNGFAGMIREAAEAQAQGRDYVP